jgi:asparagine synthase (glutamine-hydrolysing)
MCGIFGYISKTSSLPLTEELVDALDAQIHRGPDSFGHWQNNSIFLGMRRLSIIDLETGSQPIIKENGEYVLVFNGEIYNYKKIRLELERVGVLFETSSDSEVLLNAYIHYGIEFLDKLDGMFAFAIYDKKKDLVIIARDRIGEKPLAIYEDDDKWIVSSEISSMKKLSNISLTLNYESLQHYLGYGYVKPLASSYNEIIKLHPGYYGVFKDGEFTKHRYHKFQNFESITDESEAIKLADEAIERSVEAQMVADVPVGIFFSGGIDSSLVLAKMVKHNPKVKAYTIGLKNNPEDESTQAAAVAKHLGLSNITHWYTESDMIANHMKICSNFDDFFTNASAFALNLLSEFASKDVKVVLCGDGGDELFGGYSRYGKASKFQNIARLSNFLPKGTGSILNLENKYFRSLGNDSFASIYQKTFEIMEPKAVNGLLRVEGFEDIYYDYFQSYSDEYDAEGGSDILNKMAYIDVYTRLSESFLTKTDRMTMANSIESRVPLLSRELMELGLRVDGSLKRKNGQSKYILRKVLEKHLPYDLVNRKKQGFYVPVEDYFSSKFLDYTMEILDDDFIKLNPVLNRVEVDKIISQVRIGNKKQARQLWHILNFESWRLINQVKG